MRSLAFMWGHWEILLVLLVILLLFGAKKLPGLSRSLGRSLGEFRKGREEGEHLSAAPDDGAEDVQKAGADEEKTERSE